VCSCLSRPVLNVDRSGESVSRCEIAQNTIGYLMPSNSMSNTSMPFGAPGLGDPS
jgi:hypothetical protein